MMPIISLRLAGLRCIRGHLILVQSSPNLHFDETTASRLDIASSRSFECFLLQYGFKHFLLNVQYCLSLLEVEDIIDFFAFRISFWGDYCAYIQIASLHVTRPLFIFREQALVIIAKFMEDATPLSAIEYPSPPVGPLPSPRLVLRRARWPNAQVDIITA